MPGEQLNALLLLTLFHLVDLFAHAGKLLGDERHASVHGALGLLWLLRDEDRADELVDASIVVELVELLLEREKCGTWRWRGRVKDGSRRDGWSGMAMRGSSSDYRCDRTKERCD